MNSFAQRVAAYQRSSQSKIVVRLAPTASRLPLAYLRFDDPALPYGRDVISATAGGVCGWVFDLSAYLAYGAAGIIALERTLALAVGQGITILHCAFAIPDYVGIQDSPLKCDAVTVIDASLCPVYSQQSYTGVFVLHNDRSCNVPNCGWFNPETDVFQMPLVESDHLLCLTCLDPLCVQEKGDNKVRFLNAVQALIYEAKG